MPEEIHPSFVLGPRAVRSISERSAGGVPPTGVKISDKHIGVIVKQVLQKVRIAHPGDTEFLEGEHIDRQEFRDENEKSKKRKQKPATAEQLLLGITKASLTTQSFISAASFQETTRVLTDAAIRGAKDDLLGLKENIIIGHLIPAVRGSTGTRRWRSRGWRCRWWRMPCRVRTSRCRGLSVNPLRRRGSVWAGTTKLGQRSCGR